MSDFEEYHYVEVYKPSRDHPYSSHGMTLSPIETDSEMWSRRAKLAEDFMAPKWREEGRGSKSYEVAAAAAIALKEIYSQVRIKTTLTYYQEI